MTTAAPSKRADWVLVLPAARRSRRDRLAALERPLLIAGLALVVAHLLELALAGPATTPLSVAVILGAPLAWILARPHVTRATRVSLAVAVGLVFTGPGKFSIDSLFRRSKPAKASSEKKK